MTTFFLHLLLCLMAHFTRAKPLLLRISTVGQVFRSEKQVYLKAFLQECIDLECGSSFEELFKFLHSTFGTFLVHCTLDILNRLMLVFVLFLDPHSCTLHCTLQMAGVHCLPGTHLWVAEDGSYREEGQTRSKGSLWAHVSPEF